ncbi:MAG: DUF481 domain-containing protein [Tepidisphaera sp.]
MKSSAAKALVAAFVSMAGAVASADVNPRISFPSELVPVVVTDNSLEWQPQEGAAAEKPAAPAAEVSFWSGWKRNADLGLNGSSGNSETVSVRGLIGAERKTESMETKANIGYVFTNSDGQKSKSRGEANLFNNWNFGADSPWGWFAQGKVEYDEFQSWKWRFSGATGPSYTFIKNEKTTLRGRVGLGAYYETGKLGDDELHPELDVGLDFTHQFSETQKMFATVDYYPSLDEFPAYRVTAQAGYEILLSKEDNLSLKLGVQDRYDSTPGLGNKRNDVEYFVALSFNF